MTLVKLKMGLTFPSRRKEILTDGVAVKDVVRMYPWLQATDQLLQELERLGPKTITKHLDDFLHAGLLKYHSAINSLAEEEN